MTILFYIPGVISRPVRRIFLFRLKPGPALLLLALWLAALFLPGSNSRAAGPEPIELALVNATLITGRTDEVLARGLVLISRGRIDFAGPEADRPVPARARVIDLGGATVLPGLINAHQHDVYSPEDRARLLTLGATSICDLAGPLSAVPQMRRERDSKGRPTAQVFYSGPMLCKKGGYPNGLHSSRYGLAADSAPELVRAVNRLADEGASMIKISFEPGHGQTPLPMLSLDEARAVVQAAHARGLAVRAHVEEFSVLDTAIQAGVDVVEHLPNRWDRPTPAPLLQPGPDGPVLAPEAVKTLSLMAEKGIMAVPTLDAVTRSSWDDSLPLAMAGKFHALGGILAAGNDHPFKNVEQGPPLREMALLEEAGLSRLEAILAATRNSARACGAADKVGMLVPGLQADLIVVAGNPLQDLNALKEPLLVIKKGGIALNRLESGDIASRPERPDQ